MKTVSEFKEEEKKKKLHWVDICICHLQADCSGFAVLFTQTSQTFSMLILHTHIFVTETQKQTVIVLALVETWQLSAYILRDFSKKKKKADKRKKKKRREQKHFIVLYI